MPRSLRARPPPPPIPATHIDKVLPAPTGGLNTVDSARAMAVDDCVVLYNMVPSEYGLRTRMGYQEIVAGLGAPVNQVVPFTGSKRDGTNDKLFVVTKNGIYDISVGSATQVVGGASGVPWPVITGNAGFGSYTGLVDIAGGHHLLFADEENGYYAYTEGATGWQKVYNPAGTPWASGTPYTVGVLRTNDSGKTYVCVQNGTSAGSGGPTGTGKNITDNTCKWSYCPTITGFDPTTAAHVVVWKNRVFLTQRDSAFAWFGDIFAYLGAFVLQSFAGKFRAGGYLLGLWSWTYDGGIGIDDLLVAISAGGDVVVYQGTDPSIAGAFSVKGAYSVGGVPNSRHIATDFGGDMAVISYLGIVPMSKLVLAGDQNASLDKSQYTTFKIANTFNVLAQTYGNNNGWAIKLNPTDNTMVVIVPIAPGNTASQLAMGTTKKGWGFYRDLPMYSCDVWRETMYFGTADGRVCMSTGYLDNVAQNGSAAGATPVQFSLVTSFQNYGSARQKRLQNARPRFMSMGAAPNYQISARLDGNMVELPPISGASPGNANAWDSGLWDSAVWQGDYVPASKVWGLSGIGVDIALALRGQAFSRTVFTGVDVGFDVGGFF